MHIIDSMVDIVLQNIAKAQKEIDKLEVEASAFSPTNANTGTKDITRKPTQKNEGVNGHGATSTNKHGGNVDTDAELAQEKDAVNDVASELNKAKIDDDAES